MTKQIVLAIFIGVSTLCNRVSAQPASGTPINPDLNESSANPRLVRITHGDAKGTILASVAPGVIYQSTDEGATFTKVTDIPYASNVTWDCCGVLYEMPRTVGAIPAGTILFSASYCEQSVMSLNIYSSPDAGNTWTFLAAPVRGGKCTQQKGVYRGVKGNGLWEPSFEIASNGALVMFWSDETDSRFNQKLAQIRTYDGMTWQDQKDTVAINDPKARPGMAVVSQTPSGQYFMTYELCTAGTLHCPVTDRTSDNGWDFGSPSDRGTKIVTAGGRYFEHAPRNIWFPPVGSQDGALVVVGQVLFEKDGSLSPQDGEVLFANSSEDGSGEWRSLPAPVKVPQANATGKDVCENYSSALLPVKGGSALLEMASDHPSKGSTVCTSYFANEPWTNPNPATVSLRGSILSKSGPSDARTWTFAVGNNGPNAAMGTEITSITLQQTHGAACTPAFAGTQFPLVIGNIAVGASAQVPVTIDFSSCPSTAAFTVTANETANQGAAAGTIVRFNQFQ